MATILNVCMYSGMCHLDPRVELTEEQSQKLLEMVRGADEPASLDRFGTGVLGPDAFAVSFIQFDRDNLFTPLDVDQYPDIITLYSYPGIMGLWRKEDGTYGDMKWYKDSFGAHDFLTELAAPAIAKHHTDIFISLGGDPGKPPPWEPRF